MKHNEPSTSTSEDILGFQENSFQHDQYARHKLLQEMLKSPRYT